MCVCVVCRLCAAVIELLLHGTYIHHGTATVGSLRRVAAVIGLLLHAVIDLLLHHWTTTCGIGVVLGGAKPDDDARIADV